MCIHLKIQHTHYKAKSHINVKASELFKSVCVMTLQYMQHKNYVTGEVVMIM